MSAAATTAWAAVAVSATSASVALTSLGVTVQTRRRQSMAEARHQADRVMCLFDAKQRTLTVRNDSDAPIFDVVCLLRDPGRDRTRGATVFRLREAGMYQFIAPSEKLVVELDNQWTTPIPDAPMAASPRFDFGRHGVVGGDLLTPTVAFRDASGLRWTRDAFGVLARLHDESGSARWCPRRSRTG